jgi:hypothetical membrane protein
VVGGVVVYVCLDVLLRFLRPDYSLLYNAESDYGRGRWYWVMDLNFLLRGALSIAVVIALRRAVRLDDRGRGGLILIAIWGACSALLAFFADDVEGQPLTGSGIVHLALGLIAFVCVAIGTILVSASLMSDPSWRSGAAVLLAVAVAGAAAMLLLGTAFGHKHAPGGLYERIFLGLELLWIALAGSRVAARRPAADDRGQLIGPLGESVRGSRNTHEDGASSSGCGGQLQLWGSHAAILSGSCSAPCASGGISPGAESSVRPRQVCANRAARSRRFRRRR